MKKKSIIIASMFALTHLVSTSFADTPDFNLAANQLVTFTAKHILGQYSNAEVNKAAFGWNLDTEVEKARTAISAINTGNLEDYQKVILNLYRSARDYHVKVRFNNRGAAFLPINVKAIHNRLYVSDIDRTFLPEEQFDFSKGDEVLTIDHETIPTVLQKNQSLLPNVSRTETDDQILAYYLTNRTGAYLHDIPSGEINFEIKKIRTGIVKSYLLKWLTSSSGQPLPSTTLIPFYESKDGPLPPLGEVVWSAPETSLFKAYIFKSGSHKVGYIRIADYEGDAKHVSAFAELISKFQTETDALIYDQIDNSGGDSYYMNALVEYLNPGLVKTPLYTMALEDDVIAEANKNIPLIQGSNNINDLQKALANENFFGFPLTMDVGKSLLTYYQFLLSEKTSGLNLTTPHYRRVETIVHPEDAVAYSKPIIILVNELNFSCADMFPAVMQDMRRADVFGSNTSGAGGDNTTLGLNSPLQIESVSFTTASLIRANGSYLENAGVMPDILYKVRPADLRTHYRYYKKALLKTVRNLLK